MTSYIQESQSLSNNKLYAFFSGWLIKLTKLVGIKQDKLQEMLDSGKYDQVLQKAGRFAGRKPGWHLEKGVLKRVKKAKLSKHVRDFGKLEPVAFDEQLKKGEKLMIEKAEFKGSFRRLIAATVRVFKACRFPTQKFEPITLRQAADMQLNHRSSSGYPLFTRKGLVLEELILEAQKAIDDPHSFMWSWPCVRGFRIQIRESLGELARKIRLMYPYPGFIILIEDVFVVPFVAHFKAIDTFYVIGRNGEQIGGMLKDRFDKLKRIVSLDVTAYDQCIVIAATILAFGILRYQLFLSKEMSIAFENMVVYFHACIFVSKSPGSKQPYAFVKHHGVPSGSGFTNMIDTLAHAIILEYACPGLVEKALICGDDNIFDATDVNVDHLRKIYLESFNLTVKEEKTDIYPNSSKLYFLGFTYVNYVRMISPLLVVNQMLWHTDWLTPELMTPYERELARCSSILLNGKNGRALFERMFPDVIKLLDQGVDVRTTYMYGYTPPSLSKSILAEGQKYEPGINISLREHIESGYLIR